jgi:hypothetical protein
MTRLRLAGILLLAFALSTAILVEAIGIPSSVRITTAPKQIDSLSYSWVAFHVPVRLLAHGGAAIVLLTGLICLAVPPRRRQ